MRVLALSALMGCSSALAAPQLSYTGRLLDAAGAPLNGTPDVVVGLYGAEAGGDPLWASTFAELSVADGYFSVALSIADNGDPIDTRWLTDDLWVGVHIDGGAFPRQQILDVPRAALASHIPVSTDGVSGSCDGAGAIVWDAAGGALRVCDGVMWRSVGARTLTVLNGASQWSDGSVASSCRGYRYPAAAPVSIPAATDGLYWIDPDGVGTTYSPVQAFCDQTRDGGGWTRVHSVQLGAGSCAVGAGQTGNPANGGSCTKYSDAFINAVAQDKVFVSRVSGYASAFTKYANSITVSGNPGLVIQGGSLAAVLDATPNLAPEYGGWRLFAQQNWYNTDRCRGAPANTARLSQEYITDGSLDYACTGSCSSDCPSQINSGVAEVFIR